MIAGDYFIMTLMALNGAAAIAHAYHGLYVKAFYWVCALGLNWCVLRMQ